jgi:hypothetical protein
MILKENEPTAAHATDRHLFYKSIYIKTVAEGGDGGGGYILN